VPARKKRRAKKPSRNRSGARPVVPKNQLLDEIKVITSYRHLSQGELADIVGDAASQMSLLLNGKLRGFSTDRLLRMLLRLGRDVDIVLRSARGRRRGRIRVLAR
jgi:predicted XRE-type DNA-binding protein